MPMWMSLNASLRPSCTIESISSVDPIRAPNRAAGIRYGARVMFSMPPATTTLDIAGADHLRRDRDRLKPEPHSMLIVVAGTSFGIPAAIDA